MSDAVQLTLEGAAMFHAFVEQWRALEREHNARSASLDLVEIFEERGRRTIDVMVNGRRWARFRRSQSWAELAGDIWNARAELLASRGARP